MEAEPGCSPVSDLLWVSLTTHPIVHADRNGLPGCSGTKWGRIQSRTWELFWGLDMFSPCQEREGFRHLVNGP